MLESKNELDMILNIPQYEVVSNVLNEYKSRINNNADNVSKETNKVENVVSQNSNSSINNQTNNIETFDMPKNKIEDNNS